MNEKHTSSEALLIAEKRRGRKKLNAVTGINEQGEVDTTTPKTENRNSFLQLDRHGNVLDNFFKNLSLQHKNPSELEFFKLPVKLLDKTVKVVEKMLQDPDIPSNSNELNKHRVDPNSFTQKESKSSNKDITPNNLDSQEQKAEDSMDEAKKSVNKQSKEREQKLNSTPSTNEEKHQNRDIQEQNLEHNRPYQKCLINPVDVNWNELKKIGVTRDDLEKSNSLMSMLNGKKSPVLIPIKIDIDGINIETEARLAFKKGDDNRLKLMVHAVRSSPNLDRPFYGHTFTQDQKDRLLERGNAGEVIMLRQKDGTKIPILVSLDKLTNEVVALRTDNLNISKEIKGAKLTDKQHKDLTEGKPVYVEGMISKYGKPFNATLQVNADKRSVEFQFSQMRNKNSNQNQPERSNTDNPQKATSHRKVRIHKNLLGASLTEEQQAKLQKRETIYVKGMIDKKGEPFNAYVRVNDSKAKLDFFKWNPDRAQRNNVTPDSASKTQVAVNSNGKSSEQTKHINGALKKGEIKPTDSRQKRDHKESNSRSRGMRM